MSASHVEPSPYGADEEVLEVVRGFESCALPRAAWTHRAHLTVALWYLLGHPLPVATVLIREGIKRYNHAHGILTTPTGGYHETLTLFWIHSIKRYLDETPHETRSLSSLTNGLLRRYGRSNLPLEYYSRERLFSAEARACWVEPDLKTLDR